MAGLEVPHEAVADSTAAAASRPLYELLEKAADYYRQQLRDHPESQRAVDYLKQRGLTGDVAARFGIGFAPPGWDNLAGAFGKDRAGRQALLETGLAIERNDGSGIYDRFRDRIQFPIHDRRGRTIGFGGRVLGDDTPKYLNSPESVVFHKGSELYGQYEARKAMRQLDRILVVEGYMDVVALAQFDINYAVATLGTATTPEHLERIFRVVPEVIFCFDGDRAGRAAAWRALENTLPVLRDGREARFLFLPEGEDPDTLVRKIGREAFETKMAQATHLSDFLFHHLSESLDLDSIDGRARLVDLARPLLARLPDGIFHQLRLERLAEIAGTDPARLSGRLEKPAPEAPPPPVRRPARPGTDSPVRGAIALLLHQPELAGEVRGIAFRVPDSLPGVTLLQELLEVLWQQPGLNTGALLERWRDRAEGRHLEKLAQWQPLVEDLDLAAEFHGHIDRIQQQLREARITALLAAGRERSLDNEEKQQLKKLLQARAAGEN